MKKNFTILIAMLFTIASNAFADDKLYFEDFEIEPGETKVVNILLDNPEAEYRDLQFDLYLPEGITVAQDEDDEFLVELGSRCTKKHSVGFSYTDGHYVCMLYSTAKNPLTGNSGDILSITLKAADDVAPEILTGYFRNVSLSKTDATGPTYNEFSFDVTVGIKNRYIASEDVCASDLCLDAAERLIAGLGWGEKASMFCCLPL